MFEKYKSRDNQQLNFLKKENNPMQKQYKDTSYIIYDDGRCFSLLSNHFLTPKMSVTYPTYNLTINGKRKQTKIHRMVAETFIDNPQNKPIVNHKDGDTHNFKVDNLEWATYAENSQHAINTGLKKQGDQTLNKFIGNLPDEIWAPIKDYPNYIISSVGRVMNIRTKRLLKPYQSNSGGYLTVNLNKENKSKLFSIHALVYCNFYNDYDLTGYVINHIDGNKYNNNKSNLEKITYQDNNPHAEYRIKTHQCSKAVVQLDNEYNEVNAFESINQAQRTLGIKNISRAVKTGGRAGGYFWKIKK